jgi:5'-nucleotidase
MSRASKKLRILVSNDDGIHSQGILALSRALSRIAHVTVVAPEREQSTMGHALTLHKPVRIFHVASEKHLDLWATSGTPADCVYVGLRYVLKQKPDIIVSGINRGANLGNDVFYSGTIAAAREGAVMDIPAVACSLDYHYEPGKKDPGAFEWASDYMVDFVRQIMKNPLPPNCLLNVNFPNLPRNKVKGVRVTRQGFRIYTDKVEARKDTRGKNYFWLGGKYAGFKQIAGSDCEVLDQNYISVTPFRVDLTQYDFMDTLSGWVPDPHTRKPGTAKVAVPTVLRGVSSVVRAAAAKTKKNAKPKNKPKNKSKNKSKNNKSSKGNKGISKGISGNTGKKKSMDETLKAQV